MVLSVVDIEPQWCYFRIPSVHGEVRLGNNPLGRGLSRRARCGHAHSPRSFPSSLLLFQPEFSRCVREFPTTRATRSLSEYDHFLALCFGQLTYRESLRDIATCLRARSPEC